MYSMFKMFHTFDKHPDFTSLISHTTSMRLENLSRNAEKSFVGNKKFAYFFKLGCDAFSCVQWHN